MMMLFVMQKLFFMLTTAPEGTAYTDCLDVIWHGLKLDAAVTAYVVIVPWLLLGLLPPFRRLVKGVEWYYYIVALLLAVIFVADASLYPFWQFKLDASVFLYTDKPKDALASVSFAFILYRIIGVGVWVWIAIMMARRFKLFAPLPSLQWNSIPKVVVNLFGFSAVAAVLALMVRGGVGEGTNNVSAAYYSDNQYLNHSAVNPAFNLFYSMGKQQDYGSQYQFFDDETLHNNISGIYHTDSQTTDTLLKTTRPNILLIVWEGCSERVAECLGGLKGVTPCLNRIAADGVSFSECYSNSYRTDRGLVAIMSGWLGLPNASLMKVPQKCEKLPALPRTLRENGYHTTFWYGGDISFTNMGGYMRQAGFSTTVSDKDFASAERKSEWGVPDDILLQRVLKEIQSQKQPSFNAIMTLSSHEPWNVPTKTHEDIVDNAFHYTDECIGQLVNGLRKTALWDNLLVIITSDHGALYAGQRYDKNIVHIPMVWTGGAVREARVVSKLMNQSDMAATLLGQMGIGHDDFTFSRDVMSRTYTYPTATFCYNNGVLFCDSTGTTVFDNDAQRTIVGTDSRREARAKATLQQLYRIVDGL